MDIAKTSTRAIKTKNKDRNLEADSLLITMDQMLTYSEGLSKEPSEGWVREISVKRDRSETTVTSLRSRPVILPEMSRLILFSK